MSNDVWTRVLTASVVPVVVISAGGMLCLAFYGRLAAIVSRLRALQRERLTVLQKIRDGADGDPADADLRRTVLRALEVQTENVMGRARLIRLTLQCLLVALALLVVTSVLEGMGAFWAGAVIPAAVVFLAGMVSLLCGIGAAFIELHRSLRGIEAESESVTVLTIVSDECA